MKTSQHIFFPFLMGCWNWTGIFCHRDPASTGRLEETVTQELTQEREREADMAGEAGLWGTSRLGLSRCHRGQLEERGGVSFLTREAQSLSCSSISRSLASPKLSAQGWFHGSPCQPQQRLTQPLAPSCRKLLEPLASASCQQEGRFQGGQAVPAQAGRALPGPSEGAIMNADAGLPNSCGAEWGNPQVSHAW